MSSDADSSSGQDAFLDALRKEMASYLAQKLTFSLFQAGKSAELKARITDLIEGKLTQDEVALDSDQKEKLIKDILAGMPTADDIEDGSQTEDKLPDRFTLPELEDIMRPFLATRLDDRLFEEDRKQDLVAAINEHMNAKIKMDDLPVPDDQREELLSAICSSMGLDPHIRAADSEVEADEASAGAELEQGAEVEEEKSEQNKSAAKAPPLPVRSSEDSEPPEEPTQTQSVAASSEEEQTTAASPKPNPPLPEKYRVAAAAAPAKKKIPKAAPGSMMPLKALTHEIKRDLLYELSSQINPDVMACGDELAFRTEVFTLIQNYCSSHKFTLSDNDVEKLVQEILSGEGLEFQL